MQDLEIAKKRLGEKGLTLGIVNKGSILFETRDHGISGFLNAIEELQTKLTGASIADRIAGKAVALLCIHCKIQAVYATTLSSAAKALFDEKCIYVEWNDLVETILNVSKSAICQFEKAVADVSNPQDAYMKLKSLHDSCTESD